MHESRWTHIELFLTLCTVFVLEAGKLSRSCELFCNLRRAMVRHLPSAIKQLLALRNPHPLPSPAVPQLRQLLAKTHQDAVHRKAETGWLVLTVC